MPAKRLQAQGRAKQQLLQECVADSCMEAGHLWQLACCAQLLQRHLGTHCTSNT